MKSILGILRALGQRHSHQPPANSVGSVPGPAPHRAAAAQFLRLGQKGLGPVAKSGKTVILYYSPASLWDETSLGLRWREFHPDTTAEKLLQHEEGVMRMIRQPIMRLRLVRWSQDSQLLARGLVVEPAEKLWSGQYYALMAADPII